MKKKYYRSTANFFKVIIIGLVMILALKFNTVHAQVSLITNGQTTSATNSWDIKLVDINGDGKTDAVIVNVKLDSKNNYSSVPCPVEIWLNQKIKGD